MSRKSRRPNFQDAFIDPVVPDYPDDDRLTVHRLTGELEETLDTLISGCAFLAKLPTLRDFDTVDGGKPDESDDADESRRLFGGITMTTRILARALLARTLHRQPLPASTDDTPAPDVPEQALDDLTHALTPPDGPTPLRPSRAERRAAFDDAALLVRELGLEEFGVSCDLDTADDGVHELVTVDVSPETAQVELLEFLINRAENVAVDADPLLATEREASAWEFSRWSVSPPPGKRSADGDVARHIREQEYSLADRSTVALGTSVIATFADDEVFSELFPGQHRLAGALAASFVDVFQCTAIDGNRATLRSVRTDLTYVVHEHLEPVEYSVDWVAAGRLIPVGDELYLRSPGMVFGRANGLAASQSVAGMLDALEETLPPAIAVESFISSVLMGVAVPRDMKPMRTRADAREQLDELRLLLDDAQLEPDGTLGAFAAALSEQGGHGIGNGLAPSPTRRTTRPVSRRRR